MLEFYIFHYLIHFWWAYIYFYVKYTDKMIFCTNYIIKPISLTISSNFSIIK